METEKKNKLMMMREQTNVGSKFKMMATSKYSSLLFVIIK